MNTHDPKPYTTDDVRAWVEMRPDRPLLSEREAGRMRATVEALERVTRERDEALGEVEL